MSAVEPAASTRSTVICNCTFEPYHPSITTVLPGHKVLDSNEGVVSADSSLPLESNMMDSTDDQK